MKLQAFWWLPDLRDKLCLSILYPSLRIENFNLNKSIRLSHPVRIVMDCHDQAFGKCSISRIRFIRQASQLMSCSICDDEAVNRFFFDFLVDFSPSERRL
jgi:hypothetical protein